MMVSWSTSERSTDLELLKGPAVTAASDFTGTIDLTGLPSGQTIFYTVHFEDGKNSSELVRGKFRTTTRNPEDLRFVWTADLAGQGWGINPDWGGYRLFETMRKREPRFYLNSGDTIYADGPIQREVKLPDGTLWKNIVTEEKSKVAETLAEFRGNYRYNLLDENLKRLNAEVPLVVQWDDHEVLNNWYYEKDLTADNRYREKDMRKLIQAASQAFREYNPARRPKPDQIYRSFSYGPLLDVFVIDLRSYRGANSPNRQTAEGPETAFLGKNQFAWLARSLKESKATWKVIASDMPIGLLVSDGKDPEGRPKFEAIANGPGAPMGRELEIARLLASLKNNRVRNVVWLTADVHYTAAHYYNPAKAKFTDFDPFWEFVSGPSNAGTFGPNELDETFGPEQVFAKHPPAGKLNLPPSAGLQFFGEVEISAKTRAMTVTLRDLAGAALFNRELAPA
jgi:alkaline phosphatase D